MIQYLVGSTCSRFIIYFPFHFQFSISTTRHFLRFFLWRISFINGFNKFIKNESLNSDGNGPKRDRKHLWKVLYGNCSFRFDSLFLIVRFLKQLFLWNLLGQMIWNLVRSIYGRSSIEKKIFRNRPIRNKNCLWQPCLLMDRDKMSNLYKGSSIDASYQASVPWKVLYKDCSFSFNPLTNMAATGHSCFWLVDF
jgi:hypothetical protein